MMRVHLLIFSALLCLVGAVRMPRPIKARHDTTNCEDTANDSSPAPSSVSYLASTNSSNQAPGNVPYPVPADIAQPPPANALYQAPANPAPANVGSNPAPANPAPVSPAPANVSYPGPAAGGAGAIQAGPRQQYIPATAKAPGTFSNGADQLTRMPDKVTTPWPEVYTAFDGPDIPIRMANKGKLMLYSETNNPASNTSTWGSQYDNANQNACGIPVNAYSITQVSIHPFWLSYAGLDRYCMQNICISMWAPNGKDMMLKVTDICDTDPNNPTSCQDYSDIKVDRSKVSIIEDTTTPAGDSYPEPIWWYFMYCLGDGTAQPAYQAPPNGDPAQQNWFTNPPLPNNWDQALNESMNQYNYNQQHYPSKGWQTYTNGGYVGSDHEDAAVTRIPNWQNVPIPAWQPLAGGQQGKG